MSELLAVDAADIADTSIEPWQVVAAIVVLVATWIVSRIVRRTMRNLIGRVSGLSPDLQDLAVRASGYFTLFVGFGVALSFLGAQIQPLLAAVILVAVVLALALRGIADNFAAGIVIQTRRPIGVGDEIESLGFTGTVEEMTSRAVVIQTPDGRKVHLPNAEVLANPLVNNSQHGARRSELEVRIHAANLATTRARILAASAGVDGVIAAPEPELLVTARDPDRLTAKLLFWHAPTGAAAVTSAVVEAVAAVTGDQGEQAAVTAPVPAAPLTPSPKI